jgi:hypothetical protein
MVESVRIPVPPGSTVTAVDFHAPWIETDQYSNLPWVATIESAAVRWNASTPGGPPNPLRWGYLYGFSFTCDAEPGTISNAEVRGFLLPEALFANAVAPAPGAIEFRRGDCNQDTALNIADAVLVLSFLFSSGAPPSCRDACDGNDDGALDIADPIYLLAWLFAGGPAPAAPHPDCGIDGTSDALDCSSTACAP